MIVREEAESLWSSGELAGSESIPRAVEFEASLEDTGVALT